MLSLAECSSLIPIISRRAALSKFPARMYCDKVTDAYKSAIKTPSHATTAKDGTQHSSIPEYDKQVRSGRLHGADAGNGAQPTKWQKRFLVMTRLYKSQDEIPEYVATSTMGRMHNRMRAICITVAVLLFYVIITSSRSATEGKLMRDREAMMAVNNRKE